MACVITNATTTNRQREAIKAGVAEYYLDASYDRQFRFITRTNQ